MEIALKFVKAKKCTLKAKVLLDIPEKADPLLIFQGTTNLIEFVKHICDHTNLYATQNGRGFIKNPKEIRAVLDINYIISVSKLPNIKRYWSVDKYLSSDGVRNAMARNCFMKILHNLSFTDNQTAEIRCVLS